MPHMRDPGGPRQLPTARFWHGGSKLRAPCGWRPAERHSERVFGQLVLMTILNIPPCTHLAVCVLKRERIISPEFANERTEDVYRVRGHVTWGRVPVVRHARVEPPRRPCGLPVPCSR